MTLPIATKKELAELLSKIANPKKVPLTIDLSNPEYKYYLQKNGTYRIMKRRFLSSGKLN